MFVQQEDKTDIIEIPDEPLEGELLTNKFDIAFKSPLFYACERGHEDAVKNLISSKADVNFQNHEKKKLCTYCS